MPFLSRLRTLLGGRYLVAGEHPSPQPLDRLPAPPRLEVRGLPTPHTDDTPPSQRYAQIVQDLRSSLPFASRWLSPEDVEIVGEHPIGAGGFADVWEGTHGGRKVVLKSYRCYTSFDVVQIIAVRCTPTYVVYNTDCSFVEVL
jgi:hypothetical protein